MPADRFYLDTNLTAGSTALLEGTEQHHLAHVMRLRIGDEVELVNGRGQLAHGKIAEIGKKNAAVKIHSSTHALAPSSQMLLAVPMMRPSKLEWIVEKGTELGVTGFLFYVADHSEKEDLSAHQLERLRTLSISALKQSGRLYLPSIEISSNLQALFAKEAHFLFGDPRAQSPLDLAALKGTSPIVFLSGPEQGFSSDEFQFLETNAKGVRLSAHVLRAETAPIVAASLLGLLAC